MILNIPPEVWTGLGTFGGAALGAWNARQGRQIHELRRGLDALTSWRNLATVYIGQLLYVMASHGVTAPPPPDALGLSEPPAEQPPVPGAA